MELALASSLESCLAWPLGWLFVMGKHITVRKVGWWSVGTFMAFTVAGFIYLVNNPYRIVIRGDQSCVIHYFTEYCYDRQQTIHMNQMPPGECGSWRNVLPGDSTGYHPGHK